MLKEIVDGNYRVEIYIHVLDLTRNRSEKATLGPCRAVARRCKQGGCDVKFADKKIFRRKLFLMTPPVQCTILGVQKIFGHIEIFRDMIQIFRNSQNNTICHKICRICPFFLYYNPILPDSEANIA